MNAYDRAIKLHRLLAARRTTTLTVDELTDELECSSATVKRAARRLREEFEAPLIHDRERGGYRYDGNEMFEVPGLWFTAEELSALLVLDEVLASQPLGLLAEVLAPLRQRLDLIARKRGIRLPEFRERLRLLRMAARDAGPHFACVADALAQGRRLIIDYHARSTDRMAPREVSPQRLTLYRDNWYLDAWCHRREELRTFALDRIIAAERVERPIHVIEAAALDQVLATSYGIFAGEPSATARLRFTSTATTWVAAEQWHPRQRDEITADGGLIRIVPYHHADELIMDILRFGADVEVLGPASLRKAVRNRLRAAAGQYDTKSSVSIIENRRIQRIRI